MPDGSIVQNLDTDHVVSKRCNPVIADIFIFSAACILWRDVAVVSKRLKRIITVL